MCKRWRDSRERQRLNTRSRRADEQVSSCGCLMKRIVHLYRTQSCVSDLPRVWAPASTPSQTPANVGHFPHGHLPPHHRRHVRLQLTLLSVIPNPNNPTLSSSSSSQTFQNGLNSKNYCKDHCSGGEIMTKKRKCHYSQTVSQQRRNKCVFSLFYETVCRTM